MWHWKLISFWDKFILSFWAACSYFWYLGHLAYIVTLLLNSYLANIQPFGTSATKNHLLNFNQLPFLTPQTWHHLPSVSQSTHLSKLSLFLLHHYVQSIILYLSSTVLNHRDNQTLFWFSFFWVSRIYMTLFFSFVQSLVAFPVSGLIRTWALWWPVVLYPLTTALCHVSHTVACLWHLAEALKTFQENLHT